MYQRGIEAYKKVGVTNTLSSDSDPHLVIQMLFQGALEKMAYAKGCIERKDIRGKSEHITKAVSIIYSLQGCLDMSVGEISDNLYRLYDFIVDRLTSAMISNDISKIDEAIRVLIPIKTGWDKIPESAKLEGYALRAEKGALEHLSNVRDD
ncbi:flagellar export chaperone FliS [Pokkaliibacter sp. CJK22405]|uniref:flagellar export chaperone FliS n=1 Tax=Pokkaliibacter sp. CJK22405 TaxID=3384615 RepID=UPI003984697E